MAARRAFEELRHRLIRDACAAGPRPLKPLAIVRGEEEAMTRLDALIATANRGLPLERARLASLLDLRGRPEEALDLLKEVDLQGAASGAAAAVQMLKELVSRHACLAAERARRLEEQGVGRGTMQPVEVLDAAATSRAVLLERFVLPGRPCVLRSSPGSEFPPRWSPSELEVALAGQQVPTRRCDDSSVNWARLEFAGGVPFNQFMMDNIKPYQQEGLQAPRDAAQLFDYSIWQQCPDSLGKEVVMPTRWFPVDLYTHASNRVHPVTGSASPTLFLAPVGSGSALHVDFLQTHFWMAMCHGRKRWRLVPKDDLCLLHPMYLTDLNPAFPVDLDEVERQQEQASTGMVRQRPGLPQVNILEVMLEPGDLIFVPNGWPHQVENMETSVAISANFIDSSNLAASMAEAQVLGLVEEDAHFVATALREAADDGLPSRWESEATDAEPLRTFKARHGESRTPSETQSRLMKAGGGLFAGLGLLGLGAWHLRSAGA
eukprot:TRINITY_DN7970_c0_g2_i1.p1 TRINITY_DN7970_c0_g2~~TRINITY_DN7970_c0_g2_i1.p1  ORF type:complete len:491 (-),score=100.93 TRINITY_DN7970_c0_g2_i1:17-1489(-)